MKIIWEIVNDHNPLLNRVKMEPTLKKSQITFIHSNVDWLLLSDKKYNGVLIKLYLASYFNDSRNLTNSSDQLSLVIPNYNLYS